MYEMFMYVHVVPLMAWFAACTRACYTRVNVHVKLCRYRGGLKEVITCMTHAQALINPKFTESAQKYGSDMTHTKF